MRIVDYLDRGAYIHPDRAFCIDHAGSVSYAQMQRRTQELAQALLAAGVRQGSKVAVYSPNCSAVLTCIYGLNRAGAVWVPLNHRNGVAENIAIVDDLDVDTVLYHPELGDTVGLYQRQAARVRRFIRIGLDEPDSHPGPAPQGPEPIQPLWFDAGRITSIVPTGGTTGRSKGVMHTELNWTANIANCAAAFPMDLPPVHLAVAPLTHGAGAIAVALTAQGATHVIQEGFDPAAVMSAIAQHGVTHLFLPPTALYTLLAHPEVRRHDYSSLRYFIYGAAPSSPDKIEEAISVFGPVMTHAYGQTEASASIAFLHPRDHVPSDPLRRQRMRSCGKPSLLTNLRIVSSEGTVQPLGESGEIEVYGPIVMAGYYKNAEATAAAMRDGWLRTGDVGRLDEDGYLYIMDRTKEMIISGGFNVYPAEVEQIACAFEGVQDCAAIGVPDEKWGEAVKLIVQPKPGHEIDVRELLAFCRERLGGVKTPKTIELWDELPRSPVGKVLKREIRARYWQGAGRAI